MYSLDMISHFVMFRTPQVAGGHQPEVTGGTEQQFGTRMMSKCLAVVRSSKKGKHDSVIIECMIDQFRSILKPSWYVTLL